MHCDGRLASDSRSQEYAPGAASAPSAPGGIQRLHQMQFSNFYASPGRGYMIAAIFQLWMSIVRQIVNMKFPSAVARRTNLGISFLNISRELHSRTRACHKHANLSVKLHRPCPTTFTLTVFGHRTGSAYSKQGSPWRRCGTSRTELASGTRSSAFLAFLAFVAFARRF